MEVRQISFGGVGGLKEITPTTIAQIKDDGGQYLLHIKNGKAYALTSKRVSAKTGVLVDKIKNFPHINQKPFPFKKETIVVVEVSAHNIAVKNKRRTTVTSIMGTLPEDIEAPNKNLAKVLSNAEKNTEVSVKPKVNFLKMLAHDFMLFEGKDVSKLPYKERYKLVRKFFKSAGKSLQQMDFNSTNLIWAVENIPLDELYSEFFFGVNGKTAYDTTTFGGIKEFVDDPEFDEEGVVLKDMEGTGMAKVKKIETADCIIIGFTEGKGKYEHLIGAFIVAVFVRMPAKVRKHANYLTDLEVEKYLQDCSLVVCGKVSGITDDLRDYASRNKDEYLGTIIECKFMEWTGEKMFQPRFKEIRVDKEIGRCTIEQFGEEMKY